MRYKRLIDVTDFLTTGEAIFKALADNWTGIPWEVSSAVLDLDYIGNHSGDKIISPLLSKMLEQDEASTLSAARLEALANILVARYGEKWTRLYNIFSFEYDPIQNYSMEEKLTNDTEELTHGKQTQRTDALNKSITDTPRVATEQDIYIYGYDSSTESPSGKTVNPAPTGTNQTSESDTGTQTFTDSGKDTKTRNYTMTRKGNIGVTTSQQMIESEIKLWQWDFFKQVFSDIDKLLTIPIY